MTDLTKERFAMGGITIQVLALVRTLSEVLRLKYVLGPEFTIAAVRPLMVGAMIAAATCWMAVILFVLRRYTTSIAVSITAVLTLLIFRIVEFGW
jgi:hypothetical protein